MAGDDFKIETRFSSSRGVFPYVAGILGLAVVVVVFMIVTGIGRDRLPYNDYFFGIHAPTAADGSEALALVSLTQDITDTKVTIDGTVTNLTDSTIKGLQAVIAVTDKFLLPVETVDAPVQPVDLPSKGMGTFHTVVTLGEHGFGGYTIQFRLPDNGPFVPHKDEHPEPPPSEKKPSR